MKHLKCQQGFALVTSLMLTLISLTIVTAMLYLITQNIQTSGAQKRYKNVIEASYGGSVIVVKDFIPLVFQGYSSSKLISEFPTINVQLPSGVTAFNNKLKMPTSEWPATYSESLDPKSSPDLSFTLPAAGATGVPFNIYAKIVDSNQGNSDLSGLQLEGAGVAESASVVTPQHFPNTYRVEVAAERQVSISERANISILYAY